MNKQTILTYLGLCALGILFFMPFLWLLSTSFKSNAEILAIETTFFPRDPQPENYHRAVTAIPFFRYFLNTLLVCSLTVIGNLFSASLVAFSLGILRWRGREVFFAILIATMLLPPQVTMVPIFIIFRILGLIDTYVPLVAPAFFGTPFFIFLMRQFYLGIPYEIVEAGRIDGLSNFGVYKSLILPLSGPALVTVGLFSFIWAWTDFLTPLIYLQEQSKFTLSLGLQQFEETNVTDWGTLLAACALVSAPLIFIFLVAQKAFVQGIATTGRGGM